MERSLEAASEAMTPVLIKTKLAYGAGHVINDLTASMWFTYVLIFFQDILGMGNVMAGNLLLVGQVADALMTPLIGYGSDRLNGCFNYGKRKSWHLLGIICVVCCFGFLFMPIIGYGPEFHQNISSPYINVAYYVPFIVIFQFGWACVQISHLSLIPSIANTKHDKVSLTSYRYAATVLSNVTVYGTAWLLLNFLRSDSNESTDKIIPADYPIFRTLAYIMIGVGVVFSAIFHILTKESGLGEQNQETVRKTMNVLSWFKTPQFYIVGMLYMCSRLIVNIPQVYLGMYLTETLNSTKVYIAIVPLVVFVSGFTATFPMKILSKKLGKKKIYSGGLVLVCAASVWYRLLRDDRVYDQYMVMAVATLGGAGSSIALVLSLSITADLIDQNTESSAFVYGAMSFTDKLSSGIVVQIIQILNPCNEHESCELGSPYYRDVMTWVPISCSLVAFITLFIIKKRNTEHEDSLSEESTTDSSSDSKDIGVDNGGFGSDSSTINDEKF